MSQIARLSALLCALAAAALVPGAVLAQQAASGAAAQPGAQAPALAPDPEMVAVYAEWEAVAQRAADVIESGRASGQALGQLRREVAQWRSRFDDSRSLNGNAIATAERRLAGFGAAPAADSGEIELAWITRQREELAQALAELKAPGLQAASEYARADSLIAGIDAITSARESGELLRRGPSPVNPAHWMPALAELGGTADGVRAEFAAAWGNPSARVEAQAALPLAGALLLAGLALLGWGRRWCLRITQAAAGPHPGGWRRLAAFIVSLAGLGLPLAGVAALVGAVQTIGFAGVRAELMLGVVVEAVFFAFAARWLADRIFPEGGAGAAPISLDESARASGRACGMWLGRVAAIYLFVQNAAEVGGWEEASARSILFPLMIVAAALLLRIARILARHDGGQRNLDDVLGTLFTLLGAVLAAVAVGAPILAALGYYSLGEWVMLPTLASLMLLSLLILVERLVVEMCAGDGSDSEAESLIPILTGFALVLLAIPALALIWGASVVELREAWATAMAGLDVGGMRLSPSIVLIFLAVFTLGLLITRLIQGTLRRSVLPKTQVEPGVRNAIISGTGYVGIVVAALVAVAGAGIDLSSIAIVAGALSVGIGFGLQNVVSNFASGIILLLERPISEGDWIEVGGMHGTVKAVSVRSTLVQTFDRSVVNIPNSDLLNGQVTNYTRGDTVGRVIVKVGVAYGSDVRKVEAILREIAGGHEMVKDDPGPSVLFRSFGDSSLDFEIRAFLKDVNWVLSVHSDMNFEIARRFAEEGIEIPFPQRDVWLRNPEAAPSGKG